MSKKKISFILLSAILCTPTIKGMDTAREVVKDALEVVQVAPTALEDALDVVKDAPNALGIIQQFIVENPRKSGLIGLGAGIVTEEALTGFSATRATVKAATSHPKTTTGIALATAAAGTDYMVNDTAATRALGRGAKATGSYIGNFVVDGIMHPRAHYGKTGVIGTGLATATGLVIDQLVAKGKIRKAVVATAKKAGEGIKNGATTTAAFVRDGVAHPVKNKGKAVAVYGTPITAALVGTDAHFGLPVLGSAYSAFRNPITTAEAAWRNSEWLREQAQTFGEWLISNPTINKWTAVISAASLIGSAGYLLGRKPTTTELKKAETETQRDSSEATAPEIADTQTETTSIRTATQNDTAEAPLVEAELDRQEEAAHVTADRQAELDRQDELDRQEEAAYVAAARAEIARKISAHQTTMRPLQQIKENTEKKGPRRLAAIKKNATSEYNKAIRQIQAIQPQIDELQACLVSLR